MSREEFFIDPEDYERKYNVLVSDIKKIIHGIKYSNEFAQRQNDVGVAHVLDLIEKDLIKIIE